MTVDAFPQEPLAVQPTAALQAELSTQNARIHEQPNEWPYALRVLYDRGYLERPLAHMTLRAASRKDRVTPLPNHAIVTLPAKAFHEPPQKTTERVFTAIVTDSELNPHLEVARSPNFRKRVIGAIAVAGLSGAAAVASAEAGHEAGAYASTAAIVLAGGYAVLQSAATTLRQSRMRGQAAKAARDLAREIGEDEHPLSFTQP